LIFWFVFVSRSSCYVVIIALMSRDIPNYYLTRASYNAVYQNMAITNGCDICASGAGKMYVQSTSQ